MDVRNTGGYAAPDLTTAPVGWVGSVSSSRFSLHIAAGQGDAVSALSPCGPCGIFAWLGRRKNISSRVCPHLLHVQALCKRGRGLMKE